MMKDEVVLRDYREGDEAGAYRVCLKTGDSGADGEPYYLEDPDALGRIYVGPYLAYEPSLSLILEDSEGVAGYALAALESRAFFDRYVKEWCPGLREKFPAPGGERSGWSRVQEAYDLYHHPDVTCPEPYEVYPSHGHIDLLPRVQGKGWGRRMMEEVMLRLRRMGSPGMHLGVSIVNDRALGFYGRLGFEELMRVGEVPSGCIYLGKRFRE